MTHTEILLAKIFAFQKVHLTRILESNVTIMAKLDGLDDETAELLRGWIMTDSLEEYRSLLTSLLDSAPWTESPGEQLSHLMIEKLKLQALSGDEPDDLELVG